MLDSVPKNKAYWSKLVKVWDRPTLSIIIHSNKY